MNILFLQFIIISWLYILNSFGIKQEIIIYTGQNYTKNSLTLQSKQSDLISYAPGIIKNVKSVCIAGHWMFYKEKNFLGFRSPINPYLSKRCHSNFTTPYFIASARYLGPEDTESPSISFYSEESYLGKEIVVDGDKASNIPFVPRSLFSTGFSNWTFYSGSNFEGDALCYTSTSDYHYLTPLSNNTVIGSVVQGCEGFPVYYK